jgi:hypothetical protein
VLQDREIDPNAMSSEGNRMTSAEDIQNVLGSLLSSIENEGKECFKEVASIPAAQKAIKAVREGEVRDFYISLIYPLSKTIDGLLAHELPSSPEARFLFKHSQFVEAHYRRVIEEFEGSPCCADKSRTIMRSLASTLKSRDPISFDYDQQYTYHLPKVVFKTHGEIIEFFTALYRLYYGRPQPFIEAVNRIESRMRALNEASTVDSSPPAAL